MRPPRDAAGRVSLRRRTREGRGGWGSEPREGRVVRRVPLFLVALSFVVPLVPSRPAHAQEAGPPKGEPDLMARAQTLLQQKRYDEAASAFRGVTDADPGNAQAWAMLGYSLHAAGKLEEALAIHEKAAAFPATASMASYNAACALALLGRNDAAFEWLGRAFDAGYTSLASIAQDPDLAGLRADPRFAAFAPKPQGAKPPFLEKARLLHDHFGESAGDQFGWVARALGDVTGDGIVDYASTTPHRAEGGPSSGAVYVYSGATGDLLWKRVGRFGEQFGWSVGGAGDLDADGRGDVVVGAPGTGSGEGAAYVYSGAEGKLLRRIAGEAPGDRFAQDVRGVGDHDGDGVGDLLVGAPLCDEPGTDCGRVYLVSGASGEIIGRVDGERAGDQFGGGGVCGFATRGGGLLAASAVNGGPGQRGRMYVFRGAGFERLRTTDALPKGGNLGWFLSFVGDVDADGTPDLYGSDWHDATSLPGAGRAVVISGADGRVLHDLRGHHPGECFGIGVARAGDLDRDGHDDLAVGAWQSALAVPSGGRVYLHSGKDGSLLGTLTGVVPGATLGFDADGVGDVDGDGVPDLLITAAYDGAGGVKSGRAFVVSGASCLTPR